MEVIHAQISQETQGQLLGLIVDAGLDDSEALARLEDAQQTYLTHADNTANELRIRAEAAKSLAESVAVNGLATVTERIRAGLPLAETPARRVANEAEIDSKIAHLEALLEAKRKPKNIPLKRPNNIPVRGAPAVIDVEAENALIEKFHSPVTTDGKPKTVFAPDHIEEDFGVWKEMLANVTDVSELKNETQLTRKILEVLGNPELRLIAEQHIAYMEDEGFKDKAIRVFKAYLGIDTEDLDPRAALAAIHDSAKELREAQALYSEGRFDEIRMDVPRVRAWVHEQRRKDYPINQPIPEDDDIYPERREFVTSGQWPARVALDTLKETE